MENIECAGCLRLIPLDKTKKIGKYNYCPDCLDTIKTKIKQNEYNID